MKVNGGKIEQLMKKRKMTIKDLAYKSGCSISTIQTAIAEKTNPFPYTVGCIAEALGVDVTEISDSRNIVEVEIARRKLLISDICIESGVDSHTIINFINGKNCRVKTLKKISKAMGIPMADLLDEMD